MANAASQPILRIDRLAFAYPQRPVFARLDACIGPGVTLVRGDEGSGKTTLLKLVAGDLAAQAGGPSIAGRGPADDPGGWRRQVFWADPRSEAHDQATPLAYLDGLRASRPGMPGADAPALAGLLAGLGLEPHLRKPMFMLSTGSRRKVWLAAAFVAGATVTLLDDPLAALDGPSIRVVLGQLAQAAGHPDRAWLVTGYEPLPDVPIAQVIALG